MKRLAFAVIAAMSLGGVAVAQDVRITTFKEDSTFTLNGQTFTISRIQDQDNHLTGEFTKTSRQCPPFCVQPMVAVEGVETVGELEVIAFLENQASESRGLLVDSRLPEWFATGTIPGSVNIPFVTLDEENRFRDDILRALGATPTETGGLDFTNALDLMLFCNGPWCEQSARAIRNLVAAGYPPEKLYYYRGGMQAWHLLGLSVTVPRTEG